MTRNLDVVALWGTGSRGCPKVDFCLGPVSVDSVCDADGDAVAECAMSHDDKGDHRSTSDLSEEYTV